MYVVLYYMQIIADQKQMDFLRALALYVSHGTYRDWLLMHYQGLLLL